MDGPTSDAASSTLGHLINIGGTWVLAGWAFLGSVMRSGFDWKDPKTSKFSPGRFGAAIATALVLGKGAAALGDWLHWESDAIGALSGLLGYLGPAATLALVNRYSGGKLDPDKRDSGKP